MMKQYMSNLFIVLITLFAIVWNTPVLSAEKTFQIRADGLACPYCAYGIEKKFMNIEGVERVDFDLNNGVVSVSGTEALNLKESQLKKLFNDSGFTYRKIVQVDVK